jgi:hypothetical protein
MPARWRIAKDLKIAKARRSAPRSLGVNWQNGAAVKAGSIDLGLEKLVAQEMDTRKSRVPSLKELGITFNGLRFFKVLDNSFQSCKILFDPKKTFFCIEHVDKRKKVKRMSILYPSKERAMSCWVQSKVTWKYTSNQDQDLPAPL